MKPVFRRNWRNLKSFEVHGKIFTSVSIVSLCSRPPWCGMVKRDINRHTLNKYSLVVLKKTFWKVCMDACWLKGKHVPVNAFSWIFSVLKFWKPKNLSFIAVRRLGTSAEIIFRGGLTDTTISWIWYDSRWGLYFQQHWRKLPFECWEEISSTFFGLSYESGARNSGLLCSRS